jgi:intraflagellar transport protein 172
VPTDFQRLLAAAHYSAARAFCREHGLKDAAAKLSVSLLRYAGEIPADKAFYQAGMACKEVRPVGQVAVFRRKDTLGRF